MDMDTYYNLFDDLWEDSHYEPAIEIYELLGKPFWWAEDVGKYYEGKGLIDRAIEEYEHLIESYLKMREDFLPFPDGPIELYKLGRWFETTDPLKAEKYLNLYLSAEPDKYGTGRRIEYKAEAEQSLERIKWMKNFNQQIGGNKK
jgi:tetratricopeptide (TPR) repeat protein